MASDSPPNREMFVLARQARGMTQVELSEAAGISQGQISKIENGVDVPDAVTVEKLAQTLGYQPSFFYQRPFIHSLPPYHHRKRAKLGAKVLDAIHAQLNIRRMHLQDLVRSAELDPLRPLPSFDLEVFDGDAADAARTLREHWLLPRGPIKDLTQVVENAGVVVVLCDFGTDLLDGLSLRMEGLPPMIFLRSDQPADRYRFTLAHELAHLVLHYFHPSSDDRMEREADVFAGAFMIPAEDVGHYLDDLSLEKLMILKQVWGLSMQAILHRASDLGAIDDRKRDSLWRQISRAGYRRKEPIEVKAEKPSLLSEIIDVHLDDLGYSVDQVMSMLHMHPSEFVQFYLRGSSKPRILPGFSSESEQPRPPSGQAGRKPRLLRT